MFRKRGLLVLFFVLFLPIFFSFISATTYYISPTGSDTNNGLSEGAPFKTFNNAFTTMTSGDELILLDGTYSLAAGTGYINWNDGSCSACAQPKSGISLAQPTYVHAKNPGNVKVDGGSRGGLFIGRSTRKDSYIYIQGITFKGGGDIYNGDYITIKDSGFHQPNDGGSRAFGIGTNDHNMGNSYNLIEDVWIWGKSRLTAQTFRSDRNVWRRVIIRRDGCSTSNCQGEGNPNVGITTYTSTRTSLQNVIALDGILIDTGATSNNYADFAVAQHHPGEPYGNNEWLGTLSLKSPDTGYIHEPDEVSLSPAQTLKNCIAWDPARGGVNQARAGQVVVESCTVKKSSSSGDAFRIAPELAGNGGTLRNIVAIGAGRYGVNSAYQPSYVDVNGTWTSGTYNQNTCTTGCLTSDPINISIKYITRIEAGSPLKGTGFGGADYGANIVNRYGVDGTRNGEVDYNTLTANALWPWPNEARIKKEMCTDMNETRGFCGAQSLTKYIWEYLGNPCPSEICGGTDTTPPVRSSGAPSGLLQYNTTQTTLSLTTNEATTCRYSTISGTAYASMTNTFSVTGSTFHSQSISGLESNITYNYYVRCNDSSGNTNTNDYTISFKVAHGPNFTYNWNEWWTNETINFSLYNYSQLQNISNVKFANSYGAIYYLDSLNISRDIDFTNAIRIINNKIIVNATLIPEFNKTAQITLKGINFKKPIIRVDGQDCPETKCQNITYNTTTGTYTFDVVGFSVYEVVEEKKSMQFSGFIWLLILGLLLAVWWLWKRKTGKRKKKY